jgi:phospholipase A1
MPRFVILMLVFIGLARAQDFSSILDQDKKEYENLLETKYVLLPHRGTFLLPFVYNAIPHESLYSDVKKLSNEDNGDLYKKTEAEFQISFLLPIERKIFNTNLDLNLAYTHHAWWQVYNSSWSRPFRETNYMPEIFLRHVDPTTRKVGGFDFILFDFGYVHQSNGQTQLLSRSWDRIFGRAVFQSHGFLISLRGWYRLPESKDVDDNPDIYNYMGLGEIEIYKSLGKHTFSLKAPLFSHHLSSDIKYSFPWKDRLRWYVSVQQGYGHSMIEYDHPTQRYGVGIILDSFVNSITE